MARIDIKNLTRIFTGPQGKPVRAVDGVSLAVEDRELLVLVGPSGCGKTTLLRMIAGLEQPTQGTIAVDGRIMNGTAPKERDVAMVFQHHALYPHMTVHENLAFGLKVRKCPKAERERRVGKAAELLQLSDCLERRPRELSGGQRQRVALGRAMVREPKAFLFDEPLSNLDAHLREQMRAEIARLHTRLAATMLYVTHDQAEAMMLGHRIAVMNDGLIQQLAPPLEIYRHPANRFVAGFIGWPRINFFRGAIARRGDALFFEEHTGAQECPRSDSPVGTGPSTVGMTLRIEPDMAVRLEGRVSRAVTLGLRPEYILAGAPVGEGPPDQAIETVVEAVQPLGPETWLSLAGASGPFIARVPGAHKARVHERMTLRLDMGQAHFFETETGAAL